jgi:GNAT superfamily N-acetyltransferase
MLHHNKIDMIFRQAATTDIQSMQVIRNAVKENVLSDPALVPDNDVEKYINDRGKGWVCIHDEVMAGFCIADLVDDNIWALFMLPGMEGKGLGRALQHMMLDWYFSQGKTSVWLSTQKQSRAEKFYRLTGWKEAGPYGKADIKFTMSRDDWKVVRHLSTSVQF